MRIMTLTSDRVRRTLLLLGATALAGAGWPLQAQPGTVMTPAAEVTPALPALRLRTDDGAFRVAGSIGAEPALAAIGAIASRQQAGLRLAGEMHGPDAAVAQLLFGNAPFVLLDRPISRTERVPYKKLHDATPLSVPIARITAARANQFAGLTPPPALYVNTGNPLRSLTQAQAVALLSQGQPTGDVTDWGQLLSDTAWSGRAIALVGPPPGAAELETLRDIELKQHPVTMRMEPVAGQVERLHRVAMDEDAMALAVAGLRMGGVLQLDIVPSSADGAFTRYLYAHVRCDAANGVDGTGLAFLRAALSAEGQAALQDEKTGVSALTARELEAARARIAQTGEGAVPAPSNPGRRAR